MPDDTTTRITFNGGVEVSKRLAAWAHPADAGEYLADRWPMPYVLPYGRVGVSVAMATYAGDWHKLPASLATLTEEHQPGLDLEVSIAVNHANFVAAKALVDDAGLGHPALVWDATGANYGESTGRTLAIFNASKPLISAGDPDDRWRPGGLTRLAGVATSYLTDLAVGRNARFEGEAELEPSPSLKHLQGLHRSVSLYRRIDWRQHPFPWHPMTFVARTELVRRLGGWPSVPLCADVGLQLAMMTHDEEGTIAVVPEIVRDRHNWPGQVTQTSREADLKRWVEVARRLAAERTWNLTSIRLRNASPVPIDIPPRSAERGDVPRPRLRVFSDPTRSLSPTAVSVPACGPRRMVKS